MNTTERTIGRSPWANARNNPRSAFQLAAGLVVAGLAMCGASNLAAQFTITGPPALPDAYLGEYYSQEITATGGILPYTATISFGALPQGLTVNNTGNGAVIAGTPLNAGSYTFDVRLRDLTLQQTQQRYTLVVQSSRTCAAITNGMVAWWRGETNAVDGVGGHDGTLANGVTNETGLVGGAFRFDGVDDYLSVPDSPAWDLGDRDFTIEFWAKLDEVKNTLFVQQQSGALPGGFELDYQSGSGNLVFASDPAHALITRPWSPAADNWYHLAVVRAQNVCRLYVNGAPLGADQADATPVANVSGPLRIGGYATGAGFDLHGWMDELAICHRALSSNEIAAIYNASYVGKCGGLQSLQIYPATATVAAGATVGFHAGGGTPPFSFTMATNNSGGSITTAGLYTAGNTPGTDTVRVNDSLGSNALATVTVTLPVGTNFVWTGAVDDDWWKPGNWSPNGVPGANDDATIRQGSVMVSGNVAVRTLNLSDAFLSGSATFHGTLNWTNGWLTDDYLLNIAAGSTLNVLPGAMKVIQRNFKIANAGTIHWDAPWAFDSGAISNLAGGRIIITTPTPADPAVGGLVAIYHQAGAVLRVTTSMSLSTPLQLFKSGDVEITNGTLTIVRPLASSGRWSLPGGSGLRVQGDASFADGTLFDGPGPVTLTGGHTVTFAGAIHAPHLALDGAFVNGSWTLDGILNWTSGWLTDDYLLNIVAGSTLNVLPGAMKVIQRNFKIANAGTIHWDAPWAFDSGAISNLAGGRIFLTTASPADLSVGGTVPVYNQAGATLCVTNVTSTVNWYSGLPLNNQGALEIWQGILNLPGNYAPAASSSLKFGLGGTTPGTGHGRLAVSGAATLAGQILAVQTGEYVPAVSDEFTVLTCASRAGAFANTNVNTGQGVTLAVEHRPSSVALVVESVTESPCPTMTNNLVGWWRGTGHALDSAGTNHGTLQNGAAFAPGLVGPAFSLNGTNDLVQIPASSTLSVTGAITVAAWINPSSVDTNRTLTVASKYNALGRRVSWHLSVVKAGLRFLVNGTGDTTGSRYADTAPQLLSAGAWTHVVGTYHPPTRTLRIFVNGQEMPATLGSSQVVAGIYDSVEPVRIGSVVSGTGVTTNYFAGLVDELSLHHRALSPEEIQALYMAGTNGGCITPPVILAPHVLPAGAVGAGYAQTFQAGLGVPPYSSRSAAARCPRV